MLVVIDECPYSFHQISCSIAGVAVASELAVFRKSSKSSVVKSGRPFPGGLDDEIGLGEGDTEAIFRTASFMVVVEDGG